MHLLQCMYFLYISGYEELTCHCGGEVMLPPIPCGTAPPTCNLPCARIHSCDHPGLFVTTPIIIKSEAWGYLWVKFHSLLFSPSFSLSLSLSLSLSFSLLLLFLLLLFLPPFLPPSLPFYLVTHTCHNDTCPPCTFLTDKACMGNHTVSHTTHNHTIFSS